MGEQMAHGDACEMIDDIFAFGRDKLLQREEEFLNSVYENRSFMFLTEKQTNWLNAIYDRVVK